MSDSDNHQGELYRSPVENVNLQDVMRERKAERRQMAEERRQLDLQRIKDMKSTTGEDPLDVFPEEVWMVLFSELDPEDRGKFWPVHHKFRDCMKEPYCIRDILFPQIIQLEMFKRMTGGDSDVDKRLRCVSKSIMESHDRRTEKELQKAIMESKAESPFWRNAASVSLKFNGREECQELNNLLASFEDKENQARPRRFVPRALSVFIYPKKENEVFDEFDAEYAEIIKRFEEFKSKFVKLLEIIGDQIWHFSFCYEALLCPSSEVFTTLKLVVGLMPNLKWLELGVDADYQELDMDDDDDSLFPTLRSLKRVSFHTTFEHIRSEIYEAVLKANQHVRILDLSQHCDGALRSFPFDLIESLPLVGFRPFEYFLAPYNNRRLEKIFQIFNFNWPLQTIDLSLNYGVAHTTSAIGPLLEFLGMFPTLEKVILQLQKGFSFGGSDPIQYLRLLNLTNLKICLINPEIRYEGTTHFFFSLQFLLHCNKLKTLEWKLESVDDNGLRKYLLEYENGNAVDFRAGMRVLYESNIWNVFPSLDVVNTVIKKRGSGNPVCRHEYHRRRLDLDGKMSMSIGQFLKSHGCSSKNSLGECVVLLE